MTNEERQAMSQFDFTKRLRDYEGLALQSLRAEINRKYGIAKAIRQAEDELRIMREKAYFENLRILEETLDDTIKSRTNACNQYAETFKQEDLDDYIRLCGLCDGIRIMKGGA